jgi:hypothetical protein
VLAVVLSGTPALLAACAMLCVAPTSHAAGAAHQDSPQPSSCCVVEREMPPTGHTHHGTPAESVGSRASDLAVQIAATDGSCCPDGGSVAVTASAIARVDTGLLIAAPTAAGALETARRSSTGAVVARLHSPPRSPARTPLVLRV